MGQRIYRERIGRILAIALLAIMLGTGMAAFASGMTVTVSRGEIAAMEDSSTGGRRPGGFVIVHPPSSAPCSLEEETEAGAMRDARKAFGAA